MIDTVKGQSSSTYKNNSKCYHFCYKFFLLIVWLTKIHADNCVYVYKEDRFTTDCGQVYKLTLYPFYDSKKRNLWEKKNVRKGENAGN